MAVQKFSSKLQALSFFFAVVAASATLSAVEEIEKFDANMAVQSGVQADGLKWIDGRDLPLEGRAFADTEFYYDRLPTNVTASVNKGVRNLLHHAAGMQFRFTTDSKKLLFKWVPRAHSLAMDHMPSTGVSGIDVYRFDAAAGRWRYVKTGRITRASGGTLTLDWEPGTPCLVNLPLYNGVKEFALGIEAGASVAPLPPRKSGVERPVVFYGTSITQGGCASRPGMAFVNIVGRELDVPVVNLGFSGSGAMELEMSEHLAAIDASCYVLDCLWNVHHTRQKPLKGWNVDENYEPFIRNLRAKRPGVPIVMAGYSDVYGGATDMREKCARDLYWKLRAEGWEGLYFVPGAEMYGADGEGTVDGVHPNDWGMVHLAEAYGKAVARALGLEKSGAAKVARFYFADPELVAAVLDANADSGETDTAKWMTGTGDGK
ncbi:MAG: SGNH/GDSL hydrolase family protein [Kiritimatiellae bacterium]|nr:SGNH/GDSL hydrolase family protein [Kiritimatiellia bacterium]